jgi:RNA polymerase sigma-70 factor (ECF subfamily)
MASDRPLASETVAECHQAFGPMLERYAWAIVRDWSLAADVVQSAMIALTRFGGDVAPEARKNWLFRVVHREAVRVRTKQSRFQQSSDDDESVGEPAAQYQVNPLQQVIHDEELNGLIQKIRQLPAEQQQVLKMRIYEDKTFAEISAELQIPLGTALSRMRLALERLRARLESERD